MTTTEDLRRQNDLKVLRLLTDGKAVTKNDVAAEIGVTLVTASKIIKCFHERGLLLETGNQDSDRGRKACLYTLSSDACYIAAVAVTLREFTVALYNARNEQVCAMQGTINRKAPFEESWERICQVIQTVLTRCHVEEGKLLGIGYTLPGTVDAKNGIVTFLPHMKIWNGVNLKKISEDTFHVRTMVEKDNFAAVLYLKEMGSALLQNAAVVTIRGGIGCGMILDNKLIRGSNGLAGEVGHICVEEEGLPCDCGNHGCLEIYASDDAIVARLRTMTVEGKAAPIPGLDEHGISAVVEAARAGHVAVCEVLGQVAEMLGDVLRIVLRAYDPETIFIDSEYARELPFVQEVLQRKVTSCDTMRKKSRTNLVFCEPQNYSLMGARLIVYNDVFRYYDHNIMIQ